MYLAEIVSARKRVAMLLVLASGLCPCLRADTNMPVHVEAAGFTSATTNLVLDASSRSIPFNQSAVKQGVGPAALGPDAKVPYFTVRFAMPIPPSNATNAAGALA